MATHTAHFGSGFDSLRAATHLPQPARAAAPVAARTATLPAGLPAAAPAPSWMERLATWAEHQPMHHRMGSCGRL